MVLLFFDVMFLWFFFLGIFYVEFRYDVLFNIFTVGFEFFVFVNFFECNNFFNDYKEVELVNYKGGRFFF